MTNNLHFLRSYIANSGSYIHYTSKYMQRQLSTYIKEPSIVWRMHNGLLLIESMDIFIKVRKSEDEGSNIYLYTK